MDKPKDPNIAVIKVTTNSADHCYYVRFDRLTRALLSVQEYKTIYTPSMGVMAPKTKNIVAAARAVRLKTPAEQES